MKKVTINILAEDIKNTSFFSQEDCAITRALKRGGLDAKHMGTEIEHSNGEIVNFSTYSAMGWVVSKVISMYDYKDGYMEKDVPADFSFELEVPDNW